MNHEHSRSSDAVREKIFDAIARHPSRSRRQTKRRTYIVGAAITAVLVAGIVGFHTNLHSFDALLLAAVGWTAASLGALRAALSPDGMIGRPARDFAVGFGGASIGAIAIAVLFSVFEPSHAVVPHWKCMLLSLGLGAVPTAGLVWMRIDAGGVPVGRRYVAATLAIAGVMLGGLVVLIHCPDSRLIHLALGHAGAVPMAAALGAFALVPVIRHFSR